MSGESDWYRDEAALADVARRTRRKRPRPPCISGYSDLREIQRGGQGIVYAATQQSTKRRVAVKVLQERAFASRLSRRRFEREIDLAASLRHPNIVSIYDSGVTSDDLPYFVMEYIEGTPLDQWLIDPASRIADSTAARTPGQSRTRNPRSAVEQRLRLFMKICGAVSEAHLHGVIHRDLKPNNVLVDPAGEPHILDFGVAKQHSVEPASAVTELTAPDGFLGTLAYAAPEQVASDPSRIDTRTDVYALGLVLYVMLTGSHPYRVTGPVTELIKAITELQPEAPSSRCRSEISTLAGGATAGALNDELDTIVLKALAKEPERRYQSAEALRQDVKSYLAGEPIEAKRDNAWYVIKKTLLRYRLAATAAAAFVLILIVFSVTMSMLYGRAISAERLAFERLQQVSAAQGLAEDEARAAQVAAYQAERVNAFLREMLASADPYGKRGPDVRVRDVLDQAAKKVDAELADQPEVTAGIHLTIGNTYRGLGLYDDAETHLRSAVDALRECQGDDHPDVATARFDLASILRAKGDYAEAASLYRAALATYRQQLGDTHPFVAHALNSLGGLYVDQGNYDAAEPLYREALDLNRQRLGDEPHQDVAFSLLHLAGLFYVRGEYAEAETWYREALATYIQLFGDEHPAVAFCLHDLGLVLQARGEYADAERLFRQALTIRQNLLGEKHPDTLASTADLARLLAQVGRLAEADSLTRDALEHRRRVLGEEHRDTLRSQNDLARLLCMQGDLAEAEILHRQTFEARLRLLGEDHPDTLQSINDLITLHDAWGKPDRAAEYRALLPANGDGAHDRQDR